MDKKSTFLTGKEMSCTQSKEIKDVKLINVLHFYVDFFIDSNDLQDFAHEVDRFSDGILTVF